MTSPHPLLHSQLRLSSSLFHLLTLTLTLLFAPPPASTTPFPLPPYTPISNTTTLTLPLPTSPLPLPAAGRDLECFNLTTPKAHPVDPSDCPVAIDLLYHDPSGVMSLQRFSHDGDGFRVPFAWQHGACQVLLTSGADWAVDSFRLADVIVKAERVIDECPPKSKRSLGGLALVGHGKTFFVAVNGPDLAPGGDDGEGVWDGGGEVEEVEVGGSGSGSGNVSGLVVGGGGLDLMTEEGLMAS